MGETPKEQAALAAIVATAGPYASGPDLRARGVQRATLVALFADGWLDCLESTPDGDPLEDGPWWTFTPWGAERHGVKLVEYQDERPVWVAATTVEPEAVVMPAQPRQRPIDVALGWVEEMRARRLAEREEAAEAARERIKEESRSRFWGRRKLAGRKRGKVRGKP